MTSRSNHARSAGFTLIEIVVVLAILGLMATLILARGMPVSPAVSARATAQNISNALREARGQAIAQGHSTSLTLDLAGYSYGVLGKPPQAIPRNVQLSLMTEQQELLSAQMGRIRFDPDGGSSGGRVSIAGGGQIYLVGVDWISGHVSIETKAAPAPR